MARQLSRRQMLRGTFAGVGLIGALLSIPALGFVLSPLFESRRTTWTRVGKPGEIDSVELGIPTPFVVDVPTDAGPDYGPVPRVVYVVRRSKTELRAFTNVCSHMQCDVHWAKDLKAFFCPCHAGYYDIDGRVTGGPPPSPLPQWVHRVSRDATGATVLEIQNSYDANI